MEWFWWSAMHCSVSIFLNRQISLKAVKNRKCISEGHKVSLKGQVWFSIFTALLFFKMIHFVRWIFFFFLILEHTSDFWFWRYSEGTSSSSENCHFENMDDLSGADFLFLAECTMRWDSFLTSYRLVSKAWTIPLKSRTFLRKAINCYGIDNMFSCKARE